MRRISANYIFTKNNILKNGIVEIDSSNKILNIIDTLGSLKESRNLEFYNGIIVPGFINAHCHLELSELHNKLEQKERLPSFIENIYQYSVYDSSGRDNRPQLVGSCAACPWKRVVHYRLCIPDRYSRRGNRTDTCRCITAADGVRRFRK